MSAAVEGSGGQLRKNFFNALQNNFPDVIDGKVNTTHFLQSSRDLVVLIDRFGKVFSPTTYDMSKNIEKLQLKYDTNTEKFGAINDMILFEKEEGGNLATDALLWLRRAVHMLYIFFRCVNDDFYEGKKTEDLSPFLKQAYAKTLEAYHGWMAQQLFSLLVRFCPNRSQLMVILSLDEEQIHEESTMESMKVFLGCLQPNVEMLVDFYAKNNLETTDRV